MKYLHPDILSFESLEPFRNIVQFSTTRQGGCSPDAFGTFNLSYFSGDSKGNVDRNRARLCELTGIKRENLFAPYQTHGSEIVVLDENFLQAPEEERQQMLYGKDALITSLKNVGISVTTADCVPILVYAAHKNVIGAVHAGWRGTCQRILQKTVQKMIDLYQCRPSEIHAAIGPSISPEAFEVGPEVSIAFEKAGFDLSSIASIHPQTGKHHIDLREANRLQLRAMGVPEKQIESAKICTFRESERFFSARKLGIASGRMLTGICRI